MDSVIPPNGRRQIVQALDTKSLVNSKLEIQAAPTARFLTELQEVRKGPG
jgi:hypothetical protein